MASEDNKPTIKITLEDLDKVEVPDQFAPLPSAAAAPAMAKSYGTISTAADAMPLGPETKGSLVLQAWFYLGAAGFLGAFLAWGICEPAFVDGQGHRWGNTWILPLIIAFLCIGFGVAESIVERSAKKAVYRTLLAVPLGIVFGFFFYFFANIAFNILLGMAASVGVKDERNPIFWLARSLAWVIFGVAGGLVYGIIGQSSKKAQYGILGGMLGAGIGGLIFDPISMALHDTAVASRMIGFSLFGIATGAAMGVVESALKDKWLYVSSGPLAGKQFILYKQVTTLGSDQKCDIYLFKDSNILGEHAVIETRGSRVQLRANGPVFVGGQPIQSRVLQDGDLVQIGRYGFKYREKQK